MAEPAGAAGATPLLHGLPDAIAIWEILVRLPPKSLLRCRAVCPAWRRATTAREFLLAHHARQPSLPLLRGYQLSGGDGGVSLHLVPFDHRAADDQQLHPVARLGKSFFGIKLSCGGLLVLGGRYRNIGYSLCNPATRQHASLEEIDHFAPVGMYPHGPAGEYRMLLGKFSYRPDDEDGFYVFTLGSARPPRRVTCRDPKEDVTVYEAASPVLCRGSLHWHVEKLEGASNMVQVFNTTTESFRQMRAPAVPAKASLFEMDGMLGVSSFNDAATTIDIWMTGDYEREAWAFKCRVELPVAELTVKFGKFHDVGKVVAMPGDGDLLVFVEIGDGIHYIDINGKLVASFHRRGLCPTQLQLKQSLVPHAFFPTLEDYVVNCPPFI